MLPKYISNDILYDLIEQLKCSFILKFFPGWSQSLRSDFVKAFLRKNRSGETLIRCAKLTSKLPSYVHPPLPPSDDALAREFLLGNWKSFLSGMSNLCKGIPLSYEGGMQEHIHVS